MWFDFRAVHCLFLFGNRNCRLALPRTNTVESLIPRRSYGMIPVAHGTIQGCGRVGPKIGPFRLGQLSWLCEGRRIAGTKDVIVPAVY